MKSDKSSKKVSEKMGIKPGMRSIFINAPPGVISKIELPPLEVMTRLDGEFDYIHLFVTTRQELDKAFPLLKKHLSPRGKLWVSWPKAGKLGTDLKLHTGVIPAGYYVGLVESVCLSIDETWSGLRFTHPIKGKEYNNSHAKLRLVDRV